MLVIQVQQEKTMKTDELLLQSFLLLYQPHFITINLT